MTISLNERYSRQMLFAEIGEEGQKKIRAARLLLVGCGGLGAESASLLARSGVGFLRIVDRDVVEWSNLQRQALFDESHARFGVPKAVAAAQRLAMVNSEVVVEPLVADVNANTIMKYIEGIDLVVDGFDNFESRYLLNDACVMNGIPWVYGACVGSKGVAALIVPGTTPCLRCIQPDPPQIGVSPTCDTLGILGPTAHLTAALIVAKALRFIVKGQNDERTEMLSIDVWDGRCEHLELPYQPENHPCRCCVQRHFDFLQTDSAPAIALGGRNAVQVRATTSDAPDFAALEKRLCGLGEVVASEYLIRFKAGQYELTLFADGRSVVKGTGDPAQALSLVARFFGV